MLKRLEEIENYLASVRQSIENDKEILGLDPERDDEPIFDDNTNGEFLNNNGNNSCRNSVDNNGNSNYAHVLTENLINIGSCETETNGSVSSSSAIVAPVRSVRLHRPTEEELLKWDLYRNQDDLPKPWSFFKLNKSVYRPPEYFQDDFYNNGKQQSDQSKETNKDQNKNFNYDENLRPKNTFKEKIIMNNNLNNNNKNNLNNNVADPKTNPWKAREGNVSKYFINTPPP